MLNNREQVLQGAGNGQVLSNPQTEALQRLSQFATSATLLPDGTYYQNRMIAYDVADHGPLGFDFLKDSDYIMVLHQLLSYLHMADGQPTPVLIAWRRFVSATHGKAFAASFRNFVHDCSLPKNFELHPVIEELTKLLIELDNQFKTN